MNADLRGRGRETGGASDDGFSSATDDPRVANGLDEYLAELQAGRRPSRREFLDRHPEIADALDGGLEVLEFLHSAAGGTEPRGPGPTDGDALPPETVLGDYRLIREIGRGGMGVVYEARQISLDRRVAVKVLSGAGVLDPRRLQRFRIEAQAVAQLNHAHIVPIFAVGSDRGVHFYAMQYIEGYTLAEILEHHPAAPPPGRRASTLTADGRDPAAPGLGDRPTDPAPEPALAAQTAPNAADLAIPSKEACRAIAQLGIQAAEALDHAHAMGVLHRDIKPSNLLIDPRGSLWITDFGLARFRDDTGLTLTGDLVGTLRYMAPEMAAGHRMTFDPRSDIYAMGATLYELMTLRPVFDGKDRRELLRQITQDEPTPPRRIDASIPRDLETIVMKAMDKEPERRYATAGELAEDLRRFLDDQPIHARPPSPWERVGKWARRHHAVLMAAAGGALVALGVTGEMVWQERRNTAEVDRARLQALGHLGEGVGLLDLSDTLTMKGMEKFATTTPGHRPDAATREYYQWALDFYERLTRERSIDDGVRALAFRRLGFTRMVSGQAPRAEEDFRRSIELHDSLLTGKPRDPRLRDGLADAYYYLGFIQDSRGRMALAEPSFRKAIAILVERAAEWPVDAQLLKLLASYRLPERRLGQGHPAARILDEAEVVIGIRQAIPEARMPGLRDGLADAYYYLGFIQDSRGRMALAEPSFRKAIAILVERAAEWPVDAQLLKLLASYRATVAANMARDGRQPEAERERRALLDDYERVTKAVVSADGDRALNAQWAADAYQSLAGILSANGWAREQEEALRRGLECRPGHPGLLLDFANLLAFRGDADRESLDEAVRLAKQAVETGPEKPEYWRVIALAHLRKNDLPAATLALERSLALQNGDGLASDRIVMSMISWQQGRRDEAQVWFVGALDRMARGPQDDPTASRYMDEAKVRLRPMLVSLRLGDRSDR